MRHARRINRYNHPRNKKGSNSWKRIYQSCSTAESTHALDIKALRIIVHSPRFRTIETGSFREERRDPYPRGKRILKVEDY